MIRSKVAGQNTELVKSEKKGQFVHYSLSQDNLLLTMHNFIATFCPVGGPLIKESKEKARKKAT